MEVLINCTYFCFIFPSLLSELTWWSWKTDQTAWSLWKGSLLTGGQVYSSRKTNNSKFCYEFSNDFSAELCESSWNKVYSTHHEMSIIFRFFHMRIWLHSCCTMIYAFQINEECVGSEMLYNWIVDHQNCI